MKLEFDGKIFEPNIRWSFDLKPVLAFPEELRENFPAYYMYRDVYKDNDINIIKEKNLRFDITIIPPNKIGGEYIKTFGHFHPHINGLSYTEVYGVIEGKALYLLQKEDLSDFIVVEAKKGDIVVIPPNYGHVTINPTNETLKMANWVYRNFKSDYSFFKKMRGACYYYLEDGWVKNENYKKFPEIRFLKTVIRGDIYDFIRDLDMLEFLYKPDLYIDWFDELFE